MKTLFVRLLFAALLGAVAIVPARAALFDREIAFSEAEIQNSLSKSGRQEKNYGWLSVALLEAPKITLGVPEGRIGIVARIYISLLGNQAIPVDVTGNAGLRYDDAAKAFYLEKPVVDRVESQAIPKESEPSARQAVANVIAAYFRNKPVYSLREDGTPQEIAARWLLRSIRIEPGRVVATLSPV